MSWSEWFWRWRCWRRLRPHPSAYPFKCAWCGKNHRYLYDRAMWLERRPRRG